MARICVPVVTCMVAAAPHAEAVSACDEVIANLKPCVSYLTIGGCSTVPQVCCNGTAAPKASATAKADRQAACNYLINYLIPAAGSGCLNLNTAAGLPGMCGVNIPFTISASTACCNHKGG